MIIIFILSIFFYRETKSNRKDTKNLMNDRHNSGKFNNFIYFYENQYRNMVKS